ncbi:hypothetical protein G4B88_009831 [Cannabis sativa]|uniref:Uncharacterized protein n=1 Tax=Cannabis sativa TaxID=3483 RepID=A0A7J6HT96_CANSA|nr:hypothetical protein G4B88_009831 [Cannabis sativa]
MLRVIRTISGPLRSIFHPVRASSIVDMHFGNRAEMGAISRQDEEPNDRKIGKLCEYALKKPLRILKGCVRGDFIIFFNQIFDALCKLSVDSNANVQSASHLLDQLLKLFLIVA